LRFGVRVFSALIVFAGMLQLVDGISFLMVAGAPVADIFNDPVMNSQVRFWGAIWFGFGIVLWHAGDQLEADPALFRLMCGVLGLSGRSAAVDLIERHLFVTELVTVRCESDAQAQWAARNGILALMIEGTDSDLLTARAGDHAITVATNDPGELIAAVRRLLVSAGLVDEPK